MATDVEGAHSWCWYGIREEGLYQKGLYTAYPELHPSSPLEFLVFTGKSIHGMKMITCIDGGNTYRYEFIKLNN